MMMQMKSRKLADRRVDRSTVDHLALIAKAAAQEVSAVDSAAHEAASSPHNDLAEPTEAQKEAGNYKKGHLRISGMDVSVETPKGGTRSSKNPDQPWEVTMPAHYGYVRGTMGTDTEDKSKPEHVDMFIGDAGDNGRFWVINQNHAGSTRHDEHKIVTGVDSAHEATNLYKSSFSEGFADKVFHSISGEMGPQQVRMLLRV